MTVLLRFVAGVALMIAVIFAVNDATRARSGGQPAITVHDTWSAVSPVSLKGAQKAVERYTHPVFWDPGVLKLLRLPAWIVFAAAGLVFAYAGRRRRRTNVFAN
jgi:hypothetical protein